MHAITVVSELDRLIDASIIQFSSPHTRRAYKRAIVSYGHRELNREGIGQWVSEQRDRGISSQSINQGLAALKHLAREARLRNAIDDVTLHGILQVKGEKIQGQKIGNWLSIEDAQVFLDAAKSQRDRTIIAILLGCGLRREELAYIDWDQYAMRAKRRVIKDIKGKGNRLRTVPVPDWVAVEIDKWRPRNASGRMFELTPHGIYYVVTQIAKKADLKGIAPHDLRRSFAYLSRDAGAELDQIQGSLGHADISTTMRYVGAHQKLKLGDAPGDKWSL